MDHYGPLVREVKDAALMLNVMKGNHPADKNTFPDDNIDYVNILEEKPKKLKIGYSMTLGFHKTLDTEVEEKVLQSIQKFSQFGWEIESAKVKIGRPELAFKQLSSRGYGYDHRKALEERREDLTPNLASTIEFGLQCNALSMGKAREQRRQVYEGFYQYFKEYDLLITPTTPCPAFKVEWTESGIRFPVVNKKALNIISWMAFTYPFNMSGLPAASIPCGWSSDGLPIGMQIVGRRFDEKTVLQVSKAFEEIAPWQDKRPKFN
jgi:aspartyl-tRNA(Asn)/glutamyl-tRNA(Gln) amidotransferase subunit A